MENGGLIRGVSCVAFCLEIGYIRGTIKNRLMITFLFFVRPSANPKPVDDGPIPTSHEKVLSSENVLR